jgi:hypothetical protein
MVFLTLKLIFFYFATISFTYFNEHTIKKRDEAVNHNCMRKSKKGNFKHNRQRKESIRRKG